MDLTYSQMAQASMFSNEKMVNLIKQKLAELGEWFQKTFPLMSLVATTAFNLIVAAWTYLYQSWDTIKAKLWELTSYVTWKFDAIINFASNAVNKIKNLIWLWEEQKARATFSSNWPDTWMPAPTYLARARWWPVTAWQTYLVWEEWPELFTAKSSGSIMPNNKMWWVSINMGWVSVYNSADEDRLIDKLKRMLTNDAKLYNLGIY